MEINAVVFDIDGTLYPYEVMYFKSLPIFVKHPLFIFNFGRVRKAIRKNRSVNLEVKYSSPASIFHKQQAALLATRLGITEDLALQYTDEIIYREWISLFRGIKPYKGVEAVLQYLKGRGVKLGVLSDFPAEAKLEYLGISEYFNSVLCSEESGKLKPDPSPFKLICDKLDVEAGNTIYVGDNPVYDIIGAKRAGLKAALFRGILSKLNCRKGKQGEYTADFIFNNYTDFLQILLKIFDN